MKNEVSSAIWFALVGAILIIMTIVSASLKRLPLTAAIIYLVLGILLGPVAFNVISIDPFSQASILRSLAEIAVVVSLFTAGLKLRLPIGFPEWKAPILLATVSMALTVGLLALFARLWLGLQWGSAILLAGILAPTDPVLASDVQVMGPEDRDRLRFSLTAEAGLNDGFALPIVFLGFYLTGDQPIEAWGMKWLIDLLWGSFGGLAVGTILGMSMGWLVGYFRKRDKSAHVMNDFLTLGLIGLSYGIALLFSSNGFLAVFAAGLSLRRRERSESLRLEEGKAAEESALRTDTVSGRMAHGVLEFNEQLEHLGEIVIVVLAGVMLFNQFVTWKFLFMALFLLAVARPLSVFIVVPTAEKSHKVLLSWFGIRGIGSLYYLGLALEHGVPSPLATVLVGVTLCTVVSSILLHGLSATPLMLRHTKKQTDDAVSDY
jgi:NhaP-type Na+/H+ or K+/H+ antiporter